MREHVFYPAIEAIIADYSGLSDIGEMHDVSIRLQSVLDAAPSSISPSEEVEIMMRSLCEVVRSPAAGR